MNIIRDEVFYDRQLELAKKLAHVLGNKIKEIKTTEYLYHMKDHLIKNCHILKSVKQTERSVLMSQLCLTDTFQRKQYQSLIKS